MKLFLTVFLTVFFLFSNNVFASGVFDRGNGGSGVVCKVSGSATLTVLDLYEMKQLDLNLAPTIPKNKADAIEFIFHRIAKIDPILEQLMRDEQHVLLNEIHFLLEPFKNIDDLGIQPVIEPNCKLVQLAIQWDENSFLGRRFVVASELWRSLDEVNRAALIIHELYYRVIIKNRNKTPFTPVVVRQSVAFYFSEQFEHLVPAPIQFHGSK